MPGEGPMILIVDDERDIVEMLSLLLEGEGFRVAAALGGQEAIDYLAENKPDFVLLDIMMPVVDGHQVCRYIRSRRELSGLPVYMLTARNDIDNIAMAVDEGADGFITKPFDTERLVETIRLRLEGKSSPFYRSESALIPLGHESKELLEHNARLCFLCLVEPVGEFSSVVQACESEPHRLLSLWQRETGEEAETTVLVSVESPEALGNFLNYILKDPRVQIAACTVYRSFEEIPFDIMDAEKHRKKNRGD